MENLGKSIRYDISAMACDVVKEVLSIQRKVFTLVHFLL